MNLNDQIIAKTLRVPAPSTVTKDAQGATMARKLDVTLMKFGFKLSGEAFADLSRGASLEVECISRMVVRAVKELVGSKMHNPYFMNFPDGVPDTVTFWLRCMSETLMTGTGDPTNLLDCPSYGTPQHEYEDMLDAHTKFVATAKEKVTILHLGGTLAQEKHKMYLQLAESMIPLSEADRLLLIALAGECSASPQPTNIPVRENKALINTVRANRGLGLIVDTYTDILRVACAMSGGDVTLEKVTKFTSFSRPVRRILMKAIDSIDLNKLSDIIPYRGRWKRLFKYLHRGDFQYLGYAQIAADVAFGNTYGMVKIQTFMGRVEDNLAKGKVDLAIDLLKTRPGYLIRQFDRLLCRCNTPRAVEHLLAATEEVASKVALPVLLSLREHLLNRTQVTDTKRIFVNRKGRSWVTDDLRPRITKNKAAAVMSLLDVVIADMVPETVIKADHLDHALALSGKTLPEGFNIVPRGTCEPAPDSEVIRMFAYWKESKQRTDYDLSAVMYDKDFEGRGHVSWTSYYGCDPVNTDDPFGRKFALYSGDVTESRSGATEFIDLYMKNVPNDVYFIVPQLMLYCGDTFTEAESAFMGVMARDLVQGGKPYEPTTVLQKSDLYSDSSIAIPFVLCRCADGWEIKWVHLYVKGKCGGNMCETRGNRSTTIMVIRGILEREYLTARYLLGVSDKVTVTESEEVETVAVKDILKG